jgi:hypothetical protein
VLRASLMLSAYYEPQRALRRSIPPRLAGYAERFDVEQKSKLALSLTEKKQGDPRRWRAHRMHTQVYSEPDPGQPVGPSR